MSQTLKTGGTGLEHKVLEALKEKIDVYGDDSEIRSDAVGNSRDPDRLV